MYDLMSAESLPADSWYSQDRAHQYSFALMEKDIQSASLLALWAMTSGAALKEFLCHYDSGLGEKEQLFKNYFRR